jgi:hypothetical protein
MSPGDTRLYDVLNDPVIFADTSTLHGKDVPLLFNTAKERITTHEGYWSQKFLFGTDYSFLSVQAIDVILHLLSRDFQGTLTDMQKILGGNALHLAQRPIITHHGSQHTTKRITVKDKISELGLSVLETILASSWDIASLDYMLPPSGTWPHLMNLKSGGYNGIHLESFLTTLVSNNDTEQLQIWIQEYPNNYISCSILNPSDEISLRTCELASQRISVGLTNALSNHELIVNSSEQLVSTLASILKK